MQDYMQAALAEARAYLRQRKIEREMRKNSPIGARPKPWTPKNMRSDIVGSCRSGKVYKYKPMLVSQARDLDEGDGISVIVGGRRCTGVVSQVRIIGKTLSLQVSYQTVWNRKMTMQVGTFTGYQAPRNVMPLVVAPTENRFDF